MAAQELNAILLSNPQIKRLYDQARLLLKVQARLQEILPVPLADHCQVAALKDGILTLHADSSAWAARLRFRSADLLKNCQADAACCTVRTIRVRAQPPLPPNAIDTKRAALSPQTAQFLREVAESMEDPGLRATLLRLSQR